MLVAMLEKYSLNFTATSEFRLRMFPCSSFNLIDPEYLAFLLSGPLISCHSFFEFVEKIFVVFLFSKINLFVTEFINFRMGSDICHSRLLYFLVIEILSTGTCIF